MQMFYCWIRDVLSVLQKNSDSEVQRIAIDGKAIRAAAEKGGHIPYIISAYLGILCVCPAAYLFPYCNQTFSMLK